MPDAQAGHRGGLMAQCCDLELHGTVGLGRKIHVKIYIYDNKKR